MSDCFFSAIGFNFPLCCWEFLHICSLWILSAALFIVCGGKLRLLCFVRVIPVSWNEFVRYLTSLRFGDSFKRNGTCSLKVWKNLELKPLIPSFVAFVGRFHFYLDLLTCSTLVDSEIVSAFFPLSFTVC